MDWPIGWRWGGATWSGASGCTANSVAEYIQWVKIEAAKNSLESSRENVNEVMYTVGYTDPKAFRVTFKRLTGLSSMQYRNKYNRANAVRP